jgi:hypothetical protein
VCVFASYTFLPSRMFFKSLMMNDLGLEFEGLLREFREKIEGD